MSWGTIVCEWYEWLHIQDSLNAVERTEVFKDE